MDAFSTEPNLSYSDAPPVLIAGSSERAVARAKSTVGAFGVRIGNAAPLAEAAARLRQQGSASAVWVELDQVEVSEILDQLIRQLNSDVQARRYGAVVSAPK
jgi:D-serine deaminase-like pyridoxal phosphate-dependent protein